MVPQPLVPVSALPAWPALSGGRLDEVVARPGAASRESWIAAFAERFGELRPDEDEEMHLLLAADLWVDLCGHDPMISAEMEHEATFGF